MRKYHLYAAVICLSAMMGISGCSGQAKAADGTVPVQSEAHVEESTEETEKERSSEADTIVESVTGPIESMEESQPQAPESVRVWGPVTKLENGQLSIDNQSGLSFSGEIILNTSREFTYILDAVSGYPVNAEDLQDGDIIYAYIGPAMTMSLPPMTNPELIFTGVPADFKVPDYVTVKSMITDAASGESVLTSADGTEYTLSGECNIFPYLTRNIVTLDDLTEGRKVVIWSDDQNTAERIMVFAQ